MRRRAVILVMALLSAAAARAEDHVQPIPADDKCTVQLEGKWTPQEHFVWDRVCRGREANFNDEPDYGGDLDPKTQTLPESRILTSRFLETILLNDKYRQALTRMGVRITGARFTERVDLENAELHHDLWLDRSLLEEGADLGGLRSTRRITFDGSKLGGELNMVELKTDEDVSIQNSELVRLHMRDAQVAGLWLTGSKFKFVEPQEPDASDKGAKLAVLDLSEVQVAGSLLMLDGAFGDVEATGAHVQGSLILRDSQVAGDLQMDRLRVDGSLFMDADDPKHKPVFKEISLIGAHVKGSLYMTGSKVTTLTMDRLQVDGNLTMSDVGDNAEFTKVELNGAHVGGQLTLGGANAPDKPGADTQDEEPAPTALDMAEIQVAGSLLMDRARFNDMDATGAHIQGALTLKGARIAGNLGLDRLQVDGSLFMDEDNPDHRTTVDPAQKPAFGQTDLIGAHIRGSLYLSGAKLDKLLTMERLQVDGDLLMDRDPFTDDKPEFDGIDINDAHIRGLLVLRGAQIKKELDIEETEVGEDVILGGGAEFMGKVDLAFSRIGRSVMLAGGVFHDDVILEGMQIADKLQLGSDFKNDWIPSKNNPSPTLYLRNAKADIVTVSDPSQGCRVLLDFWPPVDLAGFTYRSLDGIEQLGNDSWPKRRWRTVQKWHDKHIAWLAGRWYGGPQCQQLDVAFRNWLDKQSVYSPQPYEQAAAVVRAGGQPALADQILYYSREKERALSTDVRWLALGALKIFIGYGYHLWRALIWAIFLVVVGAAVQASRPAVREDGLGRPAAWGPIFLYSFEMLLPIIRLRGQMQTYKPHGWQDYYFHFHNIMGFVLAAFLAAGLSGLSK
jgi:hypothetical protein